MQRLLLLTLLGILTIGPATAGAQTGSSDRPALRIATGTVTSVSASSLALDRHGTQMTFDILRSTRFVGRGHARDLLLRIPEPSPFPRLLKYGDEVRVTYRTAGRILEAVEVRQLARASQ